MATATFPTTTAVAFEGITKRYGGKTVLADLTLPVEPGVFTVVHGPPAAGKSVLMRLLMGLEHPDAGRIELRGRDATRVPAADRNIGYIPQSFALYPHQSVHENIAYPLKLAGAPRGEIEPVVRHAAEMLHIHDLLDKRPDQLSGGQKQRVAIARGIAKRTDLYVFDDPLAGLDFKLREQLVDDLRALQQDSAATFIYTTSDPLEALVLADRLAILDGGRIVDDGEPERLYQDPANARTMELLGLPRANVFEGNLVAEQDRLRCRTAIFDVAVEPSTGAAPQPGTVLVGIRPEDIRLDEAPVSSAGNGHARAGWLQTDGRVLLREDLGGEEIVYLDCQGIPLSAVIRHHAGTATFDLGDQIPLTIHPAAVLLFAPGDGRRIGRGGVGGE